MEKEKQIEEMRNDIPRDLEIDGKDIDTICEILVNKDYRKERQGEWIKILDSAFSIENNETGEEEFYNQYICSNCGRIEAKTDVTYCEKYCPNCGAKMKGAE